MKNDNRIILSLFLFFSVVTLFAQQDSQKKLALIIGAQNYASLPPLRNAISDAQAMTTTLKSKGFEVETLYDPKSKKEIRDAITRYYNVMRDAVGAVGIFFYAGHGTQFEGMNYIIPTQAPLDNPGDLEEYCVKMNYVMDVLKTSTKSLNIVMLDACRSIPSFTRDSGQGLTRMEAPQGSIVIFATQPGKVASDGMGSNGLFTSKFLKIVNEPGLNITEVFKKVKQEVYAESNQQQLPSVEDNSIGGDFYFSAETFSAATNPVQKTLAQPNPVNQETLPPVQPEKSIDPNAPVDFGYGPGKFEVTKIGSQKWVKVNLNTSSFSDGTPILHAKTIEEWKRAGATGTPAWCYYDNDPGYGKDYGRLYNWYAVNNARGLCPAGYHLPSDREWKMLVEQLGSDPGKKMKPNGEWSEKSLKEKAVGFSGLPGGSRNSDGLFDELHVRGKWWSSTEYDEITAWGRSLKDEYVNVYKDSYPKVQGFSVRCLKDE